jgi:hypothetical protein
MPSKKAPSKKGPSKKAKSTAKVELDPETVHHFESTLRDGLVASGAVMSTDNKEAKLQNYAKIQLDPATAARMSEVLRKGLVASHARGAAEHKALDKMTAKVKSGRPRSKKKAR